MYLNYFVFMRNKLKIASSTLALTGIIILLFFGSNMNTNLSIIIMMASLACSWIFILSGIYWRKPFKL